MLADEDFREAFDNSQVREFLKVRRLDKEDSFYYLIPFDKYEKGQFLTYAALIIDTEAGSFKCASWVEEPTRFIQISKDEALELLSSKYPQLQSTVLGPELVWEPQGLSSSPFYPYWRVVWGEVVYFITQKGEIFYKYQ